jgi:cytochrome c551/c552
MSNDEFFLKSENRNQKSQIKLTDFKMKYFKYIILAFLSISSNIFAQNATENDFYKIVNLPIPEGLLLEVGGLTTFPNGDLAVATRRGDVYIITNPTMQVAGTPNVKKFASGLHEILGLAYKDGALFAAQRGELTKLIDKNKDGKADVYETVFNVPISGHYHEYTFGPSIDANGDFFITGNVAFGNQEWWRGESRVPWRGWTMKITPEGKMEPWATGMRSPCGYGFYEGEFFYTDNQGDWQGSGGITHVRKGDFTGHPAGLKWSSMPNSPVKLTEKEFFSIVDNRQVAGPDGKFLKPEDIKDETNWISLASLKTKLPSIKTPAVWLPHGILGVSNSELITDNGQFGPFAGQLYIGDQGQSKIMRVSMEKVKGEYQGVAFNFRENFDSGVLRMTWGNDGSLFVGETNRGWGSAGTKTAGLQKLIWTGKIPFEMQTVKAMPDGFEITFTMPADKKTANNPGSYLISSYIYKYQAVYGSPQTNKKELKIVGVKVSEDGLKARLVVEGLTESYVHEIMADGVKNADGENLLHNTGYYTLNAIPEGSKLGLKEINTKGTRVVANAEAEAAELVSPDGVRQPAEGSPEEKLSKYDGKGKPAVFKKSEAKKVVAAAPSFDEIKPILTKYTCLACHATENRQIGPSYKEVAKRKYSNERIVQLIWKPEPKNWPDIEVPMAPMNNVPKADALKIAAWINSLK